VEGVDVGPADPDPVDAHEGEMFTRLGRSGFAALEAARFAEDDL
jgi:hypothetical protein